MIHRARRWVMRFDLSDEDWALLEPLLPKSRWSARVDESFEFLMYKKCYSNIMFALLLVRECFQADKNS